MEKYNEIESNDSQIFGNKEGMEDYKERISRPEEVPLHSLKDSQNANHQEQGIKPTFEGKKKNFSPKVSLSLVDNFSASATSFHVLKGMFDDSEKIRNPEGMEPDFQKHVLKASDVHPEGISNKRFKPVRLTPQETKLCYIISYLLTREEAPQLRFAIDETESGSKERLFVPFFVDFKKFTKEARGAARPRDKEWTKETFMSISEKLQICSQKIYINGTTETFRYTFPLVIFKGFIEREIIGKDGKRTTEAIGMNVELLRPFFDNIRKKNIPLTPQIFRLWKDSPLFVSLFNELNKLWHNAYVGFHKAKKDIISKYGNIKNTDKVSEVEEEIHKRQYESITRALTFKFISGLTEEDYYCYYQKPNSKKEKDIIKTKRSRFRKDIEKYLNTFVTYGLITSGKVIPKEEKIVVVFNMNFNSSNEGKSIEGKET